MKINCESNTKNYFICTIHSSIVGIGYWFYSIVTLSQKDPKVQVMDNKIIQFLKTIPSTKLHNTRWYEYKIIKSSELPDDINLTNYYQNTLPGIIKTLYGN